jgi:hypothetical protein
LIEEIRISGFTSLGIIKDERIERRNLNDGKWK